MAGADVIDFPAGREQVGEQLQPVAALWLQGIAGRQ